METKAFSLQSPEQIAKDYEGNKQKIAQAAHIGLLDPTAAVMAGMFIDRMRSAQVMEQAPTQTIAQQVLAPSGPPPQGLPTATPPQMPPQGQPMGMASGGVASLSVPDNMFDEPVDDDESYAGGGLVSFARGGSSTRDPETERALSALIQVESGGDSNAVSSVGARGEFQVIPSTAHNPGYGITPARDESVAEYNRVGRELYIHHLNTYKDPVNAYSAYQAGPGNFNSWRSAGMPSSGLHAFGQQSLAARSRFADALGASQNNTTPPPAPPPPQAPSIDSHGRALTIDRANEDLSRVMGADNTQDRDAYRASVMKDLDPAEMDRRKKQDLWSTLAQIGFGMASSNSPNFLQAVGQAGAAALPGMQDSIKARRDAERAARRDLMTTEEMGNESRRRRGAQVIDYQGNNINSYDAAQAAAAKAAFDAQQLQAQIGMNDADNQSRERTQNSSNAAQLQAARIAASGRPQTNAAEVEASQINALAERQYSLLFSAARDLGYNVALPRVQEELRMRARARATQEYQQLKHPGRQAETSTTTPNLPGTNKLTPQNQGGGTQGIKVLGREE